MNHFLATEQFDTVGKDEKDKYRNSMRSWLKDACYELRRPNKPKGTLKYIIHF